MVKQRQMTKNNNNKKRKQVPSKAPVMKLVYPPPAFLRGHDVVPLRLKATRSLINEFNGTALSGSSNLAIAFTPLNITGGGYSSLKQIFPLLNGMQTSFTKFTMTRVKLDVRQTTPLTSGGYIAFCYEASGSDRTAPPTSINDASTGQHSGITTPGEATSIVWNVADYENDWSEISDSEPKQDCGSLQFISENAASGAAVIGMITLEVDFFFAGYRA